MLKERLGVQKDKNLPMVDYRYLHEEAFKHQNFSKIVIICKLFYHSILINAVTLYYFRLLFRFLCIGRNEICIIQMDTKLCCNCSIMMKA